MQRPRGLPGAAGRVTAGAWPACGSGAGAWPGLGRPAPRWPPAAFTPPSGYPPLQSAPSTSPSRTDRPPRAWPWARWAPQGGDSVAESEDGGVRVETRPPGSLCSTHSPREWHRAGVRRGCQVRLSSRALALSTSCPGPAPSRSDLGMGPPPEPAPPPSRPHAAGSCRTSRRQAGSAQWGAGLEAGL